MKPSDLSRLIRTALLKPKSIGLFLSPSVSIKNHGFDTCIDLLSAAGIESNVIRHQCTIQFRNGSRIIFSTDEQTNKFRGLQLEAVFIDEAINPDCLEIINSRTKR